MVNREPKLIFAGETSIKDLFGGIFPKRNLEKEPRGQEAYEEIARRPIYPYLATYPQSSSRGYLVLGPEVTGMDVNGLMYMTAEDYVYGYDTRDIINDWHSLYENPRNAQRLDNHRKIPGWDIFERNRIDILKLIEKDFNSTGSGNTGNQVTRICVAAWFFDEKIEPTRQWRFNMSSLGREIQTFSRTPCDLSRCNPALGVQFIAAFSPDITHLESWPKDLGHTPDSYPRRIGTTQEFPATLAFSQQLFNGKLVKLIEAHCNQVELPLSF